MSSQHDLSKLYDWLLKYLAQPENVGLSVKVDQEKKKNNRAPGQQSARGSAINLEQPSFRPFTPLIPPGHPYNGNQPSQPGPSAPSVYNVQNEARYEATGGSSTASHSGTAHTQAFQYYVQRPTPAVSQNNSRSLDEGSQGLFSHAHHAAYRGIANPPLYDKHVSSLSTTLNSAQGQLHIPLPPKNRGDETLAEIAEKAKVANNGQLKPAGLAKKTAATKGAKGKSKSPDVETQTYGRKPTKTKGKPASGRKNTAKRSTPLPRVSEEPSDVVPSSASPPMMSFSPELAFSQPQAPPSSSPLTQMQALQPSSPVTHAQVPVAQPRVAEPEDEDDEAFLARMRKSLQNFDRSLGSQKSVSAEPDSRGTTPAAVLTSSVTMSAASELPGTSASNHHIRHARTSDAAEAGSSRHAAVQQPLSPAEPGSPALGYTNAMRHPRSLAVVRERNMVTTSPFLQHDQRKRRSPSPGPGAKRGPLRNDASACSNGLSEPASNEQTLSYTKEAVLANPTRDLPPIAPRQPEAAVPEAALPMEVSLAKPSKSADSTLQNTEAIAPPASAGSAFAFDESQTQQSQTQPLPVSRKRGYDTDRTLGGVTSEDDSFHASQLLALHKRQKTYHPVWRNTPESTISSPSNSSQHTDVVRAGLPAESRSIEPESKRQFALKQIRLAQVVAERETEQDMLDEWRCIILGQGFEELCEQVAADTELLMVASAEGP